MQRQQYFLALLSTTGLVVLTGRAGFAFSFKLPSSIPDSPCSLGSFYCSSVSNTQTNFGTVTTSVKPVSELPLGGTDAFLSF